MSTTAFLSPTTLNEQQDVRAPEIPFEFDKEVDIFRSLLSKHNEEISKCEIRRGYRKHRVNVKEMRERKELLLDETVVPDRTIDQNIRQEKTPYIRYVEQTTTVLAFFDQSQPGANFEPLNDSTTQLFRYPGWKKPWFKLVDCILTHGGSALELVFDASKPGKCEVEYIRREDLIIPQKARDIQSCLRLARRYELTKQQFKQFSSLLGFDPVVSKLVEDHYKPREDFIKIYKWFLRDNKGIVNNAWLADDGIGANNYLRAPTPHMTGRMEQQVDIATGQTIPAPSTTTKVPIYFFPYHTEEDETLLEIQGRAALDLHVQEALTSLYSSTVIGATRASRFYPTRKPAMPGESPQNSELFILKHGHVFEGEYDIFQPAWPNTIALSIAQALAVRKAQEIGQTDFAAMNRQDTAKTATELNYAKEQSEALNSVNISLFAESALELYSDWWLIIRDQANAGAVDLSYPASFNININSPTLIPTMAADAQVVKRAQRAQQYMQYYPATVGTPYQLPFFTSMMKELFPTEFPAWEASVNQQNQQTALLQAAGQTLSAVPPEAVPQDQHEQYKSLLDNIAAATGQLPAPNGAPQ